MWIGFIILSAICDAICDSIENEHFYDTIFRNKQKDFWYKRDSWDKAKKIGGWKFDGWHLFKTLHLTFLFLSIVSYENFFTWYYDFLIAGITWVVSFNFFYNKVFKK